MKNEILEELCRAFGPTGRESRVAGILKAHLAGWNLEIRTDALGNVIARRGDGPWQVFCTHLDQQGWVPEHKDKKGILHIKPVPSDTKLGQGWAVDEEGNLYRVFCKSEQKSWRAESLVEGNGEMGTFLAPAVEFDASDEAFFATALSDRVGAALLADTAKAIDPDQSVVLVFYTGRHLGFAGLPAALEGLDIERLYLVETLPCDKPDESYSPGRGPVLVLRTRRSIPPEDWVARVEEHSQGLGIKLQKGLGLDLSTAADVLARRGIPSLVLGLPLRYHSSRIERMAAADYEASVRLVGDLLRGA